MCSGSDWPPENKLQGRGSGYFSLLSNWSWREQISRLVSTTFNNLPPSLLLPGSPTASQVLDAARQKRRRCWSGFPQSKHPRTWLLHAKWMHQSVWGTLTTRPCFHAFATFLGSVCVCVSVCACVVVWTCVVSSRGGCGAEVTCKHRRLSARVIVLACINSCLAVKVSACPCLTASVKESTTEKQPKKNSVITRRQNVDELSSLLHDKRWCIGAQIHLIWQHNWAIWVKIPQLRQKAKLWIPCKHFLVPWEDFQTPTGTTSLVITCWIDHSSVTKKIK